MGYFMPHREAANFAEALDYRVGGLALMMDGSNSTPGRIVVRYVVEQYPGIADSWGVVERWRYGDRPDLGEFGSSFIDSAILRRVAGAAPRCTICRRLLTRSGPGLDCGGDCRSCMAAAGDPDCGR